LAQLRALGVDTIDLLVASHNHADHIGGMTAVLGGTVVRFYLDNGVPHTTATYQRTIQAVTASGAQYLRPTARTITLGGARLRVLPPPPNVGDQNNSSVGILVQYGEFRAVFTGDSEQFELQYWIEHDSIPRVTVVKVAHHGSPNGTTPDWIEATHPQVAVISVGMGNTYGHPSAEVIQEWQSGGATVYRTDQDGTIIVQAKRDGSYVVLNETGAPVPNAGAAPQGEAQPTVSPACCRVCTRGKACGNSCINRAYQCRQPPGCACDAKP
jgi:beta-lactamase superfamily II metal-dependent hydrolase